MRVRFLRLPSAADLPLPAYASTGAAGMDLRVCEELTLRPGERVAAPTGFCIAIEDGYEGQVRARSGLALKHGISVINGPGTIDCDYRGELKVLLANLGSEAVHFQRGDRIAQLVIAPVIQAVVEEVEALEDTERGHGGFGSTGRQ